MSSAWSLELELLQEYTSRVQNEYAQLVQALAQVSRDQATPQSLRVAEQSVSELADTWYSAQALGLPYPELTSRFPLCSKACRELLNSLVQIGQYSMAANWAGWSEFCASLQQLYLRVDTSSPAAELCVPSY